MVIICFYTDIRPPSSVQQSRGRNDATKQRPAVTRKERRFQWTQENMNTACAAVSSGTMSQRNAAKHYEFLGQPCRKY